MCVCVCVFVCTEDLNQVIEFKRKATNEKAPKHVEVCVNTVLHTQVYMFMLLASYDQNLMGA